MSWWDKRWLRVALCVGIASLLYLPGLGEPALWEPDEGRYAEIAREMVQSGDYVTPRDDYVRYLEKPPLAYWITAMSIRLLGLNETAVRLPVALSSVGQIALTQIIADSMFGAAAGICAALCLALSPLFFAFSRFLTLDPPLALFLTGAMACIWMATRKPNLVARGKWLYLAAVLIALGTLTKGPVALVLCGASSAIYLMVEKRGSELFAVPWLACAFIYSAIVLPWFILVALRNPGFASFFFVHEHLQRYAASTEHRWGPYFFAVIVLAGIWPWIMFVPIAIKDIFPAPEKTRYRSGLRFALVWFAVVFLFFSMPRSKLGSYILPGLPPLAIAAGYGLSALPRLGLKRSAWLLAIIAVADVAVAAAGLLAAPRLGLYDTVPALRTDLTLGACAAGLGAVVAFGLWRAAGRAVPAIAMLALGMAIALAVMAKAREDAAPMVSYRQLARAVSQQMRPGCVLASYRHHVQALPFYTGAREALVSYRGELAPFGKSADASASFIDSDDALRARWRSGSCVILVINRTDYQALRATLTPHVRQIGSEGKKLAITNLPAPTQNRLAPRISELIFCPPCLECLDIYDVICQL